MLVSRVIAITGLTVLGWLGVVFGGLALILAVVEPMRGETARFGTLGLVALAGLGLGLVCRWVARRIEGKPAAGP